MREHERDLVAPAVLGLFCGLRTSEIARVDLGSLDFSNPDEEGEFILRATQSKTGRARAVTLSPSEITGPSGLSLRSDAFENRSVIAGLCPTFIPLPLRF